MQGSSPVLARPQELRDPGGAGSPCTPRCLLGPVVPPCRGAVCECMTRAGSAEISKRELGRARCLHVTAVSVGSFRKG